MKKSVAVLALLMMGSSQLAFAESMGDYDAGAQLRNTLDLMERAKVAQQIEEDIARKDGKIKPEQAEEDYKGELVEFAVTKFDYEKSAVLPEEKLNAVTAEFLNKPITIKDLYRLVGKINKMYQEEGYLTCKAYLPPQRVSGGVVKLMLVEGRTGNVELNFVKGNKTTRTSYIQRRVKLPKGEIMDMDDLNRQMVYFNGTNDAQLFVKIKPGETNGTTDFTIDVYEPQKYSHTFFTDNAGNETTGYYRAGYFMNIKSLTGNRDSLTMGGIYSKGSFAWSAAYDTPISKSGTKLSVGYSGNSTEIKFGDYRSDGMSGAVKGHSTAYTLALRQPCIVNETTRAETGLEFTHQSADSTWANVAKWVDDLIRDLNLYYSHTSYGKSHFFYQKHSYTLLGDYSSGTSSKNDVSNMRYYKLNTYYQKAYQHRQAINIRFDAQKTWNEEFPSSRAFYLGGMNSVRGYKESYISGYSGFSGSFEYQVPITEDFKHNGFVFYDYGKVSPTNFDNTFIHSLGVGIKSNWNKHVYSTITAGFPLKTNLNMDHVSGVRINYMISGTF